MVKHDLDKAKQLALLKAHGHEVNVSLENQLKDMQYRLLAI